MDRTTAIHPTTRVTALLLAVLWAVADIGNAPLDPAPVEWEGAAERPGLRFSLTFPNGAKGTTNLKMADEVT